MDFITYVKLDESNKILTENEQSPIPHIATHWKYTYKNFEIIVDITLDGCFLLPIDKYTVPSILISNLSQKKLTQNTLFFLEHFIARSGKRYNFFLVNISLQLSIHSYMH